MKKNKIYYWLSMAYVVITGIFNLFGYFNLPSEIATQFGSGNQVNHMPKLVYLVVSFGIVLILSLFCMTKEQEQKLKYLLVNTLIVIANIVLIAIQL